MSSAATDRPRPRTTVVVPAHDEARQIAPVVAALRRQLADGDRIVVVADNCNDDTAAIAREAGAEVIERNRPEERGKGYAIAYALQHLAEDPPEVVLLSDADCLLSDGGVETLSRMAAEYDRPVQAEYVLAAGDNPTPKSVVGALAILVKNRVRPRGLRRLGFPCQLTGSGMAFPWAVLRDCPATGSNLVEDLVMGVELALQGHPPLSCPAVQVHSELPSEDDSAKGQRRRWEHGHLSTIQTQAPRLLAAGLVGRRLDLLALGLDLMVPPLAFLMALQGAFVVASTALAIAGGSTQPVGLALLGVLSVATAVALAWAKFGRTTLPLRYALMVPAYVLWKVPLYASYFLRGRHESWDRTLRDGEQVAGESDQDKPTSGKVRDGSLRA